MVNGSKIIHIASSIAVNDNLALLKFMKVLPYLPVRPRPNITTYFQLVDISQSTLQNSLSLLRLLAWAGLLTDYPDSLQIYLLLILRFGAQLGYKGPTNAFIFSKNLASALMDTEIIDKKLTKDLASGRMIKVINLSPPFIFSPLGLMPKYNRGWKKIYHLLHLVRRLVNDNIPDGVGEMRYTQFQDALYMVTKAGRSCVIIKRNMKHAFRNMLVALHHQWLLGFIWKKRYYKEIYLLFGLTTALFIFKFFGKSLHWILVFFLYWVLVHYLDNFVAVFIAAQAAAYQTRQACQAYN